MTIERLAPRLREIGRIRIGATNAANRPVKLETFRLTSPNQASIIRAAQLWGGTPEEWMDAPSEGVQWQVVTETAELPVLVPPQDIEGSQYLELWSGGGVQRRCDGRIELLTGGPCICQAEGNGDEPPCRTTTHLQVILAMLPDVGVWRITTHGYYAAVELPATVEMLMSIAPGKAPAATMGIELRTSKAGGQTRHFAVPVLRLEHALADLTAAAAPGLPASGVAAPVADTADGALNPGDGHPEAAPSAPASEAEAHNPGRNTAGTASETPGEAGATEEGAPASPVEDCRHGDWSDTTPEGKQLIRGYLACGFCGYVAARREVSVS